MKRISFTSVLFSFLTSLFLLSPSAYALENLGFCHEYLSDYTYEVVPGTTVQLTEDQVLVRGELDPYHEQGMEDKTLWAIFESKFLNIYGSPYDALFGIEPGDKVYILDKDQKTILHEGYFNEFQSQQTVKFLGQDVSLYPNRPQLFADPELKTLLLDHKKFSDLFHHLTHAVVIKKKDPNVDYEKYKKAILIKWAFNKHPGRFVKVTPHFTYEREFGENIAEVTLEKNTTFSFLDTAGTRAYDHHAQKLFAMDKEGRVIFKEDSRKITQETLKKVKALNPDRIYIVVRK